MTSEIRANTLKNRVGLGTVSFTNTGPVVSGIVTANGLELNSVDTGSSAGPELKLFRNSASPADADYLGQLKFAGESDTGVERNYAKITGKILDASNGTEDGILEFAHIKAGSQTITGRWRSDSLQLLNSTNFSVAGDTTLTGDLDVDGHTNLDNVSIAGFTTISSTSNGEIFRIETSAGNPGGTQGLSYMGFDHFPASTKPAILIGCEEDGNASYKGNFVVKLKDAAATDDDPVQRFKIDSSGRVIIGRASAYASNDADNLIVGDEAVNEHQGITILSHSGKYGGIYFGDGAGSNPAERGKIIYDHPNDQLRIGTGGAAATQFYINSSGYVGVNVSPSARLDVKQDNAVAYNNRAQSVTYGAARFLNTSGHQSGGTYTGFQFNLTGNSQNRICAIGAISEASNSRNSSLVFATDDNGNRTEKVRIDSSGRLLVNRTAQHASSSEKLSVNGMTSILLNSTSAAPLYVYNEETTSDGTVQPFFFLHDGNGIRGGLGLQRSTSNFIINANNVIQFRAGSSGVGGSEIARIDTAGLRVNKTSTSDYGKFEVKGGTADNIETSDITAKTVATFSGSTPGTTAAGKGVGIVIKPISNRGCNYFFGVANDSANQEAHGRFIIRSGNFAGTTSERLRIASDGDITPGSNSQNLGDGTTNFASIWASTRFRGNDDVKLVLGNSQDLVVRHSGGVNYIESPQGGNLFIKSGTGDNANLRQIQCNHGGSVLLYYNDGERVKTTADGIEFGGEVNFTSGYNVRTFAGTVYLSDGQHADIVQHNSGYAWSFFEFYCISYHGSIGRCRWHGNMARYSNNENYPTINNSMGYTDVQRSGGSSTNIQKIRIQRTGTYGTIQYNYYVRCYAANSTANWSASSGGGATKKYDGN